MFSVLVCEDEKSIRSLMCEYLTRDKYKVFESDNGEAAVKILERVHIDLLITDIMMPKMDGYTLVNHLRNAAYELPILMITAKETIEDKKKGFKIGTDDYMVKPVDMDEMTMRVAALLRRAKIASDKRIVVGSTVFDYETFMVTVNDIAQDVPKKEFMLIFKLLSQVNRIFTRQQLMDEIWGYD
ncbi:MAG: response regulator transcription factor [Vallitaleaceae bacterium]|nr:response regulator transcription factor [Vallitaleaceae bacterium]